MTITARLEADGLTSLVLDPYAGFAIQALDLGDAVTRDVASNAPDADGTDDVTAYIGARTVIMSIALSPKLSHSTRDTLRNRLRAFTHPRLRPKLYMSIDGAAERVVTLRRGTWSDVMQSAGAARVTVQWVAPYGIIESGTLHQETANASTSGAEGGRAYDLIYDRAYAGGATIGQTAVINVGTADAYPILRVYGLCTNPVITNVTQGKSLAFTGLTINAGEFLEINTRARTVYYLGNSADSRYDKMNFASSAWWTLSPGINLINFTPATFSTPSQTIIEYRDAWL